ncbi:tyrosine-type recombinase/integrase [Gallionella capsiferriformans]|uniref:Integrase family protein n=1 Tax=Gallionella capsiferriformans (strain ES-2) TaxID=395494 RepID=D9SDL4_GALCS|nr:integrase family protein [Gallionella capsiferriformans]ADL54771.1 integrase family protein [Gallionella capsiferriformans ES-2]
MITSLSIKAALAKAIKDKADVFLSDDTGQRLGWRLQLRCLPSGSATWIFRYTHNGKRYQINLGTFPSFDIQTARTTASHYAAIYKENTDVLGKLRADEQAKQAAIDFEQEKLAAIDEQRKQRDEYTLSKLMTVYVNYLKKQNKIKSANDVISLSKHLAPISNKPASEISKRDLVTVQRTLLDMGKGRTANKLRSFVSAAYALTLRAESDSSAPESALDFATTGGVNSNPAAQLAVAKGFNGTSDRVLTDKELFQLLEEAKHGGAAGLAIRATVFLAGQRMAQLLRGTVTDIEDNFLTLLDPKGKREEPRRHPIPLEGMADIIISEAVTRAQSLDTKWLFSSTGKVKLNPDTVTTYVSGISTKFVESGVSSTPFKLADLRRTLETRMAGLKIPKDIRAQLMSHGLGGIQSRHYDRHEYEEEKREALNTLHAWLRSLNNPKNAVSKDA